MAQLASADQGLAVCTPLAPDATVLPTHETSCMTDAELQTFRGGFLRDNKLVIGFGFERIVRVDGEIQEHVLAGYPGLDLANNIQLIPVNRSIDPSGGRLVLDNIYLNGTGTERVLSSEGALAEHAPQIQIVPSSAALQDIMSNVIQNELDNKVIDQIRVINIEVMGMGSTPRFDPQIHMNPALLESLGF